MADALLTPALFDSLTKGATVRVKFGYGMNTDRTFEFTVGRRSHSAKYNTASITLAWPDGAKRVKVTMYHRLSTGHVSIGVGDMATVVTSFEVVTP